MVIHINELKESNDFLNTLFENINSAIFITDNTFEIKEFNTPFKNMFKTNSENILGKLCGNVLGCKFAIEENKKCGETSNCFKCTIRKEIKNTFINDKYSYKDVVNGDFYISRKPIRKYFNFSTKHIIYNKKPMVVIILDDITEIEISRLELENRNKIIEAYTKKIKNELKLASEVQRNIIPESLPQITGIDFYTLYKPMEEVGGDMYDIFKIDDDNIGIFISDVSGHGIPAAMVTTMIKAALTHNWLLLSPVSLMEHINSKLNSIFDNIFITALYCVYNIKTKEINYIRCGHPYPILIRNSSYMEIDYNNNLILGALENVEFQSSTLQLLKGDKILLFTDGLLETKNKAEDEFNQQLFKVLPECYSMKISNTINHIYNELLKFSSNHKIEDDICILGMEIL